MASTSDRSATMNDWVENGGGGTFGFQPRMVPLSVAHMKTDGPELSPWRTTKLSLSLKTIPVGAPATWTTSGNGVPSPVYRVDTLVPLSATHHGVVGPATSPQALTRFGSVCAATPGWSDTRSVSVKLLDWAPAAPGIANSSAGATSSRARALLDMAVSLPGRRRAQNGMTPRGRVRPNPRYYGPAR